MGTQVSLHQGIGLNLAHSRMPPSPPGSKARPLAVLDRAPALARKCAMAAVGPGHPPVPPPLVSALSSTGCTVGKQVPGSLGRDHRYHNPFPPRGQPRDVASPSQRVALRYPPVACLGDLPGFAKICPKLWLSVLRLELLRNTACTKL